jgi:hypothetical protein
VTVLTFWDVKWNIKELFRLPQAGLEILLCSLKPLSLPQNPPLFSFCNNGYLEEKFQEVQKYKKALLNYAGINKGGQIVMLIIMIHSNSSTSYTSKICQPSIFGVQMFFPLLGLDLLPRVLLQGCCSQKECWNSDCLVLKEACGDAPTWVKTRSFRTEKNYLLYQCE